ncbi:MAG TPA: PEP-CTERM sorting domain-containing protein, partial [Candidatus Dormibacteraeota bacterium]|nr:PEP-CTERM sorting domain-containing protein [Candidatus Dormibacteraeota bacterium]
SPMAANQSVPDSAAVRNVRTNIIGTATPSGTTAINLYTIDIFSTSGVRGSFDFQSGQALKNVPGDQTDGTVAGNTVSVEAPSVPTTVPEPASMVLLGSSLIGLGFLRRTQRS